MTQLHLEVTGFLSDYVGIAKGVSSLESSPQFEAYSRVVIEVSEDLKYTAGTDTGRTLTMTCPWGTQQIANDILARIKGYKYQPYTASNAFVNPAAELGDAVALQNIYGGIFTQDTRFGGLCGSSISSPSDEEIDHEYPYLPKQERKITKQVNGLLSSTAQLVIDVGGINSTVTQHSSDIGTLSGTLSTQAGEIAAKVSKTGGKNDSFGWSLNTTSWKLTANSKDVLVANKDGVTIEGKITATGGKIGGFTINSNSLSSNGLTWKGDLTQGIYIGPEGIKLGKNFKVDNQGNLSASSGTFTGEISAKSIKFGKDADTGIDYGKLSGSAISDGSITGTQIQANGIGSGKLSKGVNTSLGYADYSNNVFSGSVTAGHLYGKKVQATESFIFGNYKAYVASLNVTDNYGQVRSLLLLGLNKV
jgi:hypothetical protein